MFFRLLHGMTDHFVLRAPSWIMSLVLLGLGLALYENPHTFTHDVKAYQYVYLNRIIDQRVWALACTLVGTARVGALIVNGTFEGFKWSNHMRAVGSGLACFIWLQIGLGVWQEGLMEGWTTAMPIYAGLLAFDVFNTYAAMLEIESGTQIGL